MSSYFGSIFLVITLLFFIALLFMYFENVNLKDALINALPLSIISSSVAIPSTKNLSMKNREFVVYETSFHDILGILILNFLLTNKGGSFFSFCFNFWTDDWKF